jgi:ABC-type nitrate/sulfonate/bicarbonate transport system ATPase subunit
MTADRIAAGLQEDRQAQLGKDTVLSAKGLSRSFSDSPVPVFEDVSLTLQKGEFVSVLGLSGSGKTTLFNILAGLDRPDKGEVVVTEKIGYMMQKDLLLPWKRLIDNIALPYRLSGLSREEARANVRPHLARFGLTGLEMRWPSQLSGGQGQRAALLRTICYGGTLLLLDEPFSGLDAITRRDLQLWLAELVRELDLTVLLITHDIEEALALSDRLLVLSAGHPSSLHPPLKVKSRDSALVRKEALELLYRPCSR